MSRALDLAFDKKDLALLGSFIKEESMNHDMATAQSVQKPGEQLH